MRVRTAGRSYRAQSPELAGVSIKIINIDSYYLCIQSIKAFGISGNGNQGSKPRMSLLIFRI